MGNTVTHMCLDVEGFISSARFPSAYKGMFKHDDGSPMSPEDARAELFDCLRRGWRVIPLGQCSDFDYQTGCRGHPEP